MIGKSNHLPYHHSESPVAFGLIVAIILIIVLCCLCILLCLMREAMARRKKKRKGKSGGSSKPFFPATRRSTGLPGFGALSRKLSGGSKRSKGPPSAGKKLSRRASSKRSLLNSKPGSLKPKGVPGTRRSSGASGGRTGEFFGFFFCPNSDHFPHL